MNKDALVTSIAIIMGMTGHEAQLHKMSIKALEAMYSGLLANAEAYALMKSAEKEAVSKAKTQEKRIHALEADVRRLTTKRAK